jgi:ketosteroid isomerase-like protein
MASGADMPFAGRHQVIQTKGKGPMAIHSDTATASPLHAVLEKFFETKTACDVNGTMAYFAPDMAAYIDATLGWDFDSFGALKAVFEQYMPGWAPPARSYASKILAGEDSALVHMVDTPELFGGELRILAAIDFADGKIVRWVDYWDSTAYDRGSTTSSGHRPTAFQKI